jgi:dTDP-4-dehydrorhamnose reductase
MQCGQKDIPFIYVSTDYVFSGEKKELYTEDDKTGPCNIYGMTKLAGESFAAQYAKRYAVVRTSWLYGSRVNEKNFVDAMLNNLKTKSEVGALDDQSDSPTYAPDLSQAIGKIAVALSQDKSVPHVLQFCNSGVTTRLEMTKEMAKLLGGKVKVNRIDPSSIPNRVAVRPRFAAMSVRRYEAFFGLKVRPWQEPLAEYVMAAA